MAKDIEPSRVGRGPVAQGWHIRHTGLSLMDVPAPPM